MGKKLGKRGASRKERFSNDESEREGLVQTDENSFDIKIMNLPRAVLIIQQPLACVAIEHLKLV